MLASPYGGVFAVGDDDEDMWGGLTDTEIGEAYGVGRLGLVGAGRSAIEKGYEVMAGTAVTWTDGRPRGLVTADHHQFAKAPRDQGRRSCFDAPLIEGQATTVTLCFAPGDVGEIEKATGFGTGCGVGTGCSFGGRGKRVPQVRQAKAEVKGGLDKGIIRRIVRTHINEVRYCYNQGLMRDPALAGKISIQLPSPARARMPPLPIARSRTRKSAPASPRSSSAGRSPNPIGEGVVAVTYPFVLEPSRIVSSARGRSWGAVDLGMCALG